MWRNVSLGLATLLLLVPVQGVRRAEAVTRTWNFLTTGNGFGFQGYDADKRKITTFLEHPYRFVRPRPDPRSDGFARRNLAFDFYFGVKGQQGGGWLNDPMAAQVAGDPSYLEESHIIRAPFTVGGASAETFYVSPFGLDGNVMLAFLHAPGAREGYALFNFHLGTPSNPDSPDADGERLSAPDAQTLIEKGPGGGAMVYVALSPQPRADCDGVYNKVKAGNSLGSNTSCSGFDVVPAIQNTLAADGWMAVAVGFTENDADAPALAQRIRAFAAGRAPDKLLGDIKAELEAWRKPIPKEVNLSDAERRIWRQGESTLRMGQVREPETPTRRNTGMILASLPRGEWHTGWVRDGMYAIVGLARTGHHAEARAGLDFMLNATPVGKFKRYVGDVDYRISVVRYFGTGEEDADYSGQPSPNVEIDGWGMMMWAARQYVDASGDIAWLSAPTKLGPNVYQAIETGVANALERNLEDNFIAKADSSIWEVHDDNKQHFAYTTLATYRGFCDMATLALRTGKTDQATRYRELAIKVRAGFLKSFLDPQGAIGSSLESLSKMRYADGAVVEAFTWNLLDDFKGRTATATLDLLNRLRVSSGGFKRNENNKDDYDNNEWILIDLRMSDAMRRAGRVSQADELVSLVVDKAVANFHLLPELYNAVNMGSVGAYTGSVPMVGYGPGAFTMTLLDRAGLLEPSDCGVTTISVTDAGVTISDAAGSVTGDGGGSTGPRERSTACICTVGATGGAPPPLLSVPWLLLFARLWRRRRAGGR